MLGWPSGEKARVRSEISSSGSGAEGFRCREVSVEEMAGWLAGCWTGLVGNDEMTAITKKFPWGPPNHQKINAGG